MDIYESFSYFSIFQGLVQTLQAMGGGEENWFFLRHVYQNFKKIFGGGTYEEAWEDKMAHVKEVSEEAYDWLMTTVPKKCMA